jgi:ribosomal-protein-alanine N-acetyltransferase
MTAYEFKVNEEIYLSPPQLSDKEALIEGINDPDVSKNTSSIPYPYTEAHADEWLARVKTLLHANGMPMLFAIRNADKRLIGATGMFYTEGIEPGAVELGYWLHRNYRGKGIIPQVLNRLGEIAKQYYDVQKFQAHIFTFNPSSARALEKAGFINEGLLKDRYIKNGESLDCIRYIKNL